MYIRYIWSFLLYKKDVPAGNNCFLKLSFTIPLIKPSINFLEYLMGTPLHQYIFQQISAIFQSNKLFSHFVSIFAKFVPSIAADGHFLLVFLF